MRGEQLRFLYHTFFHSNDDKRQFVHYALCIAAHYDKYDIVEFLIKNDSVSVEGITTALEIAIENKSIYSISCLFLQLTSSDNVIDLDFREFASLALRVVSMCKEIVVYMCKEITAIQNTHTDSSFNHNAGFFPTRNRLILLAIDQLHDQIRNDSPTLSEDALKMKTPFTPLLAAIIE